MQEQICMVSRKSAGIKEKVMRVGYKFASQVSPARNGLSGEYRACLSIRNGARGLGQDGFVNVYARTWRLQDSSQALWLPCREVAIGI